MPKNKANAKFASSTVVVVVDDGGTLLAVPDTIPVVSVHDELGRHRNESSSRCNDALHNNERRDRDSDTQPPPVVARITPPFTRNDDERTQPRVVVGRDPPGKKYQYPYVSHKSQRTLT